MLYGVGVNDANYSVSMSKTENGKSIISWECPYYRKWRSMLARCYSKSYQINKPTYKGCYVCNEWLTFSNFKSWMEQQDWEGKQLDKDLLVYQNKVYSPETCCFITQNLNTFLEMNTGRRGQLPIGVTFHKKSGKFYGQISKGSGTTPYLGSFDTPQEAHNAWQKQKVKNGERIILSLSGNVRKGLERVINKIKQDILSNRETFDF